MEIIYRVTFYVYRACLKNNQSRAAISASAVPPHVRAFFKLKDTNDVTRNLDCWRNRLRVSMWRTTYEDGHSMRDSTHVGNQNSPSSSLWICTDQPPKLHVTEKTVTKTNAIVKSAENISFCNSSSFLYLFY